MVELSSLGENILRLISVLPIRSTVVQNSNYFVVIPAK